VAPDYLLSTPDSAQNITTDTLLFASCFWPAVVILLGKKRSLLRSHRVFFWFEVIPVAYAGLTIATMGMFEQRLIGFYVGACGAILCAIVWFTDVFIIIRGRIIRNHPLSNSQQVDS